MRVPETIERQGLVQPYEISQASKNLSSLIEEVRKGSTATFSLLISWLNLPEKQISIDLKLRIQQRLFSTVAELLIQPSSEESKEYQTFYREITLWWKAQFENCTTLIEEMKKGSAKAFLLLIRIVNLSEQQLGKDRALQIQTQLIETIEDLLSNPPSAEKIKDYQALYEEISAWWIAQADQQSNEPYVHALLSTVLADNSTKKDFSSEHAWYKQLICPTAITRTTADTTAPEAQLAYLQDLFKKAQESINLHKEFNLYRENLIYLAEQKNSAAAARELVKLDYCLHKVQYDSLEHLELSDENISFLSERNIDGDVIASILLTAVANSESPSKSSAQLALEKCQWVLTLKQYQNPQNSMFLGDYYQANNQPLKAIKYWEKAAMGFKAESRRASDNPGIDKLKSIAAMKSSDGSVLANLALGKVYFSPDKRNLANWVAYDSFSPDEKVQDNWLARNCFSEAAEAGNAEANYYLAALAFNGYYPPYRRKDNLSSEENEKACIRYEEEAEEEGFQFLVKGMYETNAFAITHMENYIANRTEENNLAAQFALVKYYQSIGKQTVVNDWLVTIASSDKPRANITVAEYFLDKKDLNRTVYYFIASTQTLNQRLTLEDYVKSTTSFQEAKKKYEQQHQTRRLQVQDYISYSYIDTQEQLFAQLALHIYYSKSGFMSDEKEHLPTPDRQGVRFLRRVAKQNDEIGKLAQDLLKQKQLNGSPIAISKSKDFSQNDSEQKTRLQSFRLALNSLLETATQQYNDFSQRLQTMQTQYDQSYKNKITAKFSAILPNSFFPHRTEHEALTRQLKQLIELKRQEICFMIELNNELKESFDDSASVITLINDYYGDAEQKLPEMKSEITYSSLKEELLAAVKKHLEEPAEPNSSPSPL